MLNCCIEFCGFWFWTTNEGIDLLWFLFLITCLVFVDTRPPLFYFIYGYDTISNGFAGFSDFIRPSSCDGTTPIEDI